MVSVLLDIIVSLCFFILHTCANTNTAMFEQFKYLNIDSLSFISTSIVVPIVCVNDQWILATPTSNAYNSNTISLTSFINELLEYHLNPSLLTIQLQILNTPQHISINQINQLYQIINNQSIINITNIIINPQTDNEILEIMSKQPIQITLYLTPTLVSTNRMLLSNTSTTTTTLILKHELVEKESWVCAPWPIYIGFFCGIVVTALVTIAIRFSTGEQDTELNTALEKVITAGIQSNQTRSRNSSVAIHAPQRHKRYPSGSGLILYTAAIDQTINSPTSKSATNLMKYKKNRRYSRSHEPSWVNDLNFGTKKRKSCSIPKHKRKFKRFSMELEPDYSSNNTDNDNTDVSDNDSDNYKNKQLKIANRLSSQLLAVPLTFRHSHSEESISSLTGSYNSDNPLSSGNDDNDNDIDNTIIAYEEDIKAENITLSPIQEHKLNFIDNKAHKSRMSVSSDIKIEYDPDIDNSENESSSSDVP